MKNTYLISILLSMSLFATRGFSTPEKSAKVSQSQLISLWPAMPKLYRPFNWKQRTQDFTRFIFNWDNVKTLPSAVWNRNSDFDTGPYKGKGGVFTLADFYGDKRIGYHNLFTNTAAVFSGALAGLPMDKMVYHGQTYNYVDQLSAYYLPRTGRLTLEPKRDPGYSDWWFEVTSNLLYFGLGDLYPDEKARGMDDRLKAIADTYENIISSVLSYPTSPHYGFNHLGFDQIKNVFRDVVQGMGFNYTDSGLGMATIEYFAFKKFGDPRYLAAAKLALDYYEKSPNNQFYDNFAQFGVYLSARIGAELGLEYNPIKYIDWTLEGNAAIGVFQRSEGSLFDLFGASGFKRSYGQKERTYFYETTQYAFMLPAVKYYPSLALTLGKWFLHASTHASYFYPDQKAADSQAEGTLYRTSDARFIPYEALEIVNKEGKSHFAESDPHRWKDDNNYIDIYKALGTRCTYLSVYSGVWAGLWGGTIKQTNIPGILQLDANKLDFYSKSFPTFLYYNPYPTTKNVEIRLNGSQDLYDVISGDYIKTNQSGLTTIPINANDVVLLVLIPAGKSLTKQGTKSMVDDIVVSY